MEITNRIVEIGDDRCRRKAYRTLSDVLESEEFRIGCGDLSIFLGTNEPGKPIMEDLSECNHLLVTGKEGNGKTSFVSTLLLGLISKYTPEEISEIEASIDRSVPNGVRDFAIILLLSRYGIRSCDIASLTFENVDFDSNRISFIQQKTGTPWEAELLPEVKSALLDYINNVRPKETNHDHIFLTLMIPIKPIDYRIINTMVGERIKESAVNINGRKHGSRAFRSSIASNMINDSVSTEVVRKVLGHGTKYALTHYVKIDIESMRICPLPVQEHCYAGRDC